MDPVDDAEVRQSLYSFYAGSKSVPVFIWLHSIGPDFSSPLILYTVGSNHGQINYTDTKAFVGFS